jgi:hypothetical protein
MIFTPFPPTSPSEDVPLEFASDSEDDSDYTNEKTPLIRHISGKTEPGDHNIFRTKQSSLPTVYSTISDCKTGTESSWSDGNTNDDDERSISGRSTA